MLSNLFFPSTCYRSLLPTFASVPRCCWSLHIRGLQTKSVKPTQTRRKRMRRKQVSTNKGVSSVNEKQILVQQHYTYSMCYWITARAIQEGLVSYGVFFFVFSADTGNEQWCPESQLERAWWAHRLFSLASAFCVSVLVQLFWFVSPSRAGISRISDQGSGVGFLFWSPWTSDLLISVIPPVRLYFSKSAYLLVFGQLWISPNIGYFYLSSISLIFPLSSQRSVSRGMRKGPEERQTTATETF